MPFGERRCFGEGRGGVDLVDLSLNVGMSCGPVVDLFCGAREALWRRRAILWRYVTDVPSPCSAPRGFFVVRCLADGGVLVLGAAGGREAGGESGHCLVCGSGEEIRRVERSGRGWSAFISSADSRVDVRKARFSERCTRAP